MFRGDGYESHPPPPPSFLWSGKNSESKLILDLCNNYSMQTEDLQMAVEINIDLVIVPYPNPKNVDYNGNTGVGG